MRDSGQTAIVTSWQDKKRRCAKSIIRTVQHQIATEAITIRGQNVAFLLPESVCQLQIDLVD